MTSDKADLNPVTALYRDLLSQLDTWFADASGRNSGVVPCRAGCSACCHGPFDISVADAVLVRGAVARLSPDEQVDIAERAQSQVARMVELEPEWRLEGGLVELGEDSFDRLCESLAEEPCPLLDQEGRCRIYHDRPMVCRMMGLAIITPAGRGIENSCPIAEQFPDYAALSPQPLELEALEEIESTCLEAASVELFGTPTQAHFETTIAILLARP